jgi:hypothetical protein
VTQVEGLSNVLFFYEHRIMARRLAWAHLEILHGLEALEWWLCLNIRKI